ncbi:SDR family NAD(P)-dependent oxidoreductase [Pontibacter diazotrophicus]|uniref:SDR family NAD(P)-dependent oxidoreductase n=1 Tax=Pontibacter diazotrophicus TaxID=1400979 RepID=A0A3D8L6Q8_9BACT|nr:SDR family oxidoreductase [Pontibacter diazotrophicus]RDV12652.1 SDR family NAD(P)-dependent oxidoreductase [Pontibacter diazotrophicus]
MSAASFKQQVAIVTGAGQGIGFRICQELAKQGASVLLNDIDEQLAVKAAKSINDQYGDCIGLAGDAANPQFIQQMVNTAVSEFGRLTIAIANAGITVFGDFLTYTPEDLQKVTQMNLGGSFFLAQAAAKQIIKQHSGGSILFMSSVTGHQAHKNLAAYGMTKAALELLAKHLVLELSPYRINVNALAPGATLTERTAEDGAYEKTWSTITPMGRPAYPSDIAHAALFLVSENARHITGQSLVIDGGWTSVSPSPYE